MRLAQALWVIRCSKTHPFIVVSSLAADGNFESETARIADKRDHVCRGMRPPARARHGIMPRPLS